MGKITKSLNAVLTQLGGEPENTGGKSTTIRRVLSKIAITKGSAVAVPNDPTHVLIDIIADNIEKEDDIKPEFPGVE